MPPRMLSVAEQRRRSLAIQRLSRDWTARQVAKGVDGPVPDERPETSDYNQHVPAMEAGSEAMDEYFARLDEILGADGA